MYKLAFPPTPSLVGNRIKLKKIKWGRREVEGKKGKRMEGEWKGKARGERREREKGSEREDNRKLSS